MKIFIHIDMDCYFAQAECKRLGIDPSKPLCAISWDSILAINYPARALGITKDMFVPDALKICKDILLPHVDTIKFVDGQIIQSTLEDKFKPHNQHEEKGSLEYFRSETKLIFQVLHKHFKFVEKGGCDEAYIELDEDEIENLYQYEPKLSGVIMTAEGQSQEILQPDEEEQFLFRASQWVSMIRQEIKDITYYESSAGISFNKMLAKLGSGSNKPFNQTVVLDRYLPQCIRKFKIGKIRGFNGKIRHAFSDHEISTLAQAQDASLEHLKQIFNGDSDQANYVYQKIRGFDDETLKVVPDIKSKSIQSLKNIKKIDRAHKALLEPILELLLYDISMRIADFYEDSGLVPSVISIIYINLDSGYIARQKSEPIQLQLPIQTFQQQITDTARIILNNPQMESALYPLVHIGVGGRTFIPINLTKIEQKFTLKQFSEKIQEDDKQKLLIEVEQMINPENYYTCEECQNIILKEIQKEHQDYHFAMSIDQEVNPNRKRQKTSQTQIQVTKIKPEPLIEKPKNQRILKNEKVTKQKNIPKQDSSKTIMNYFQLQKK